MYVAVDKPRQFEPQLTSRRDWPLEAYPTERLALRNELAIEPFEPRLELADTQLQAMESVRIDEPINSLAPGGFQLNCRYVILKLILVPDGWGISCEIDERHWNSLMTLIINIGSGNGMGLLRQQAITWAKVDPDLCRHRPQC